MTKRYMDDLGFRTEDEASSKQIRKMERWLREILARGATIPEAVWEMSALLGVALENVRGELVRASVKKKRGRTKRARASAGRGGVSRARSRPRSRA